MMQAPVSDTERHAVRRADLNGFAWANTFTMSYCTGSGCVSTPYSAPRDLGYGIALDGDNVFFNDDSGTSSQVQKCLRNTSCTSPVDLFTPASRAVVHRRAIGAAWLRPVGQNQADG